MYITRSLFSDAIARNLTFTNPEFLILWINKWINILLVLLKSLEFAMTGIIGSQEIQEGPLQELIRALGKGYSYYSEKTREDKGRSNTNTIFFNQKILELIDIKTIHYVDQYGKNQT